VKQHLLALVVLIICPGLSIAEYTLLHAVPGGVHGGQAIERSEGAVPISPNVLSAPNGSAGQIIVRGRQTPEAYGASHSLATLDGCTAASGSNRVSCPGGTGDFAVNQGVRVNLAGFATPLTAMAAPTLTVNGSAGLTSYIYSLCTADPYGGIVGCNATSTGTGNATLTLANSISLTGSFSTVNAALGLLYRKIGSGPFQFVTVINAYPFYDIGWTPPCSATGCGWPVTPPKTTVKQDLFSYITAISGTTLTLNDNALVTLEGTATVSHDDTLAWQSALTNCAGGIVQGGPYIYPINQSSFWDFANKRFWYTFTNSTGAYPALFGQGMLELPSNCTVQGTGKGVTYLQSARMTNPSGQSFTFGFNTGQHQNPFNWTVTPTNCAISNASVGQTSITATTPACAGKFVAGDYIMIAGGANVGGGTFYSNEFTQVVSSNATTGVIQFTEALQKPCPLGTPGLSPTVYKMNAEIVHDIGIRDLTIQNWSGAISGQSSLYRANLVNVAGPYLGNSNGGFFYGLQTIRHLTCENCDLVENTEWSLDEDVTIKNGTTLGFEGPIVITEASSSIRYINQQMTLNEWACGSGGATCTPTTSTNFGIQAQQQASTNFQILSSTITCNEALSNATETNNASPCLGTAGGTIAGFTPYGLSLTANTITTNSRYGILSQYSNTGARVDSNALTMNMAAENPIVGLQVASGTVNGNYLLINAPAHTADGYAVLIAAPVAPFQAITMQGDTVDVEAGGQTHTGINVQDPGSVDSAPITISGNNILHATTGVQIGSTTNTPTFQVTSNTMDDVGTPYSPTSAANAFITNLVTSCKGDVTLSSGSGTFSNGCITSASACRATDITTPANACTVAAPGLGSVAITGTGSDHCSVFCI
jgi:hypothetical protein